VLPRAIIRDLFEGHESRVHIAAVSLIFSIAPLIAPTLGAAILAFGSWRIIYMLLTGIGVAVALVAFLLFDESHAIDNRRNLRPATVVAGYRRALTTKMCVGFAIVNALVFAGLFAYVNVSPLLFIQGFGVSKAGFGGLFAITASGVIAGSSINNWLVRRRAKPRTVLDAALVLVSLAALALLAIGIAGAGSPLVVVAPVMVYITSFGLVVPNASHEAVHPLPEIAGVASAVLLATQMLFGALGGAAAAALYRHASPMAIGVVMSFGALSAAALYFLWLRPGVEA
jgi:MFS transporter, DHA1 family, multidrug resistance protein